MRNFDKYSFYIISSISFCVNSDLRFFISRSKLLLPNITFAYSSPCPSFLKRLPSPFFLHILAVRCAPPSSPVYPCHPALFNKKHPKIQRNAQYRFTKACSHVSEPVDPRHCASKNTKKHPTVLLPCPACLERLHTASSQSILIKTFEPLNTGPGLHILPGLPVHPLLATPACPKFIAL